MALNVAQPVINNLKVTIGDDRFDWTDVVDLSLDEVAAFNEGAGEKTMAGLKIFAEEGPVILANRLIRAEITNYGHFQSRVTRRTRTIKGNRDIFLFTWDDWGDDENLERGFGHYAVSTATYDALRSFFGLA